MEDPYQVLGVPASASEEDIKRAYRVLARLHHPDQNPGRGDTDFKAATAAYEELSDPEKRRQYDAKQNRPDFAEMVGRYFDAFFSAR